MTVEALIRSGTREGGEFTPIGMAEALRTATMWLSMIRHQGASELSICVGKDADFLLASDWAQKFGTENLFADRALSAANAPASRHENTETSLVLAFGSGTGTGAKTTQGKLALMRKNGAKIISINPIKTGLSALADQWMCIRPGADEAVLQVLLGKAPCNYHHLADTGLSVLDMERLLREIDANSGKVTIIAGRGIFSHVNGSHTSALLEQLEADILPVADHVNTPFNMANLLDDDSEAVLCIGSAFPWHSHSIAALHDYEGRIIALSDQPEGFESSADLVFCGKAEDNLIALAAHLGLKDFSDAQGNSPYANGYADYCEQAEKASPIPAPPSLPLQPIQHIEPNANYPFHAISQKAPADANRAVVFMNANKARFLGLASKDIVWVKTKDAKVRAVLGLMKDMNENTVWSWGSTLFSTLMPQTAPLQDPTTGQPAWFDLQVTVEKVDIDE